MTQKLSNEGSKLSDEELIRRSKNLRVSIAELLQSCNTLRDVNMASSMFKNDLHQIQGIQ